MNHKRKRPKNSRAGCLLCKPHKMKGVVKTYHIRGRKTLIDRNQFETTNDGLTQKSETPRPSPFA